MCSPLCVFVWVKKSEIESDSPMLSHSWSPTVKEFKPYILEVCWHFQMILGDNVASSMIYIYINFAKLPIV